MQEGDYPLTLSEIAENAAFSGSSKLTGMPLSPDNSG
jgi:hypothetical protein